MSKSNSDELDRILWGLTDQSAWDLSGITQKQSDDLSETLSADRIEAKELIEAEYSKREREARIDELKQLEPPEQYEDYAKIMGSESCTICGFNAIVFRKHISNRIAELNQEKNGE